MVSDKQKKVTVVCPNPSVDIYAWVDEFALGIPNRIKQEERYPGGKGLHVAMALAELDVEVTIIGFWGGEAGQWIKNACNTYYPKVTFAGPVLPEWSRSCYTFKSSQEDFDDTEILGAGPVISGTDVNQLMAAVEEHLPDTSFLALCGSWPTGSPADGYQQIIELSHQYQVPAFLDCTGVQLKNALSARPYAIHLNRKEVTDFFETDSFDHAKKNILQHCEVAAITDGSRGLHYLTAENALHSLAKVDKVISTIGSGDCLLAGIIAGHVRHLDQQQIADLGAACGAANCLRPELGMLHQRDVEQLLANLAHGKN